MLSRVYRTESEIRKRQINTLKVFNDNVNEINEGNEYQVSFQAGGNDFSLVISLTADFPNEKPILKIIPFVVHPWVNGDGEITSAPGLLNFTVHSDLGRVVQAVIREFERNPPPLVSEQLNNSNITSPTVPMGEIDNMGRVSPNYHLNYVNRLSFSPPTSSGFQTIAFPELNNLSLDELQFLNENEDRLEEFLENLPQMKEMNRRLDDTILNVEEMADSNLSKEEQLVNLQKGIDERIEEVTKLAFENERLNVKYQSLSDKYSPRNIQEELKLAAEQSERDTEKIAESFLKGEMDVDKFVTLFMQSRALTQMRKTKEEKLSQQLESLERAGF
ncbi:vacuolar protein sorting-associated protein 37A [Onthophagus taurus]|uniref:vacuolar protein sorting-associated protein 37A n=1 Tax=Onthophagus taurus TaxID=166361 RepID=UPI000C204CDB|nr:vacuolar protein sorting-associated protein 37A [Onthophagus taurus]